MLFFPNQIRNLFRLLKPGEFDLSPFSAIMYKTTNTKMALNRSKGNAGKWACVSDKMHDIKAIHGMNGQ